MASKLDLKGDPERFPAFCELPTDPKQRLDTTFYGLYEKRIFLPYRHWVFLCEIESNETWLRPRFFIKDRTGRRTHVMFYLDSYVKFDFGPYVVGHTLALFYADFHSFLDGTSGIRMEDLKLTKVIPCPLETLLSADPDAAKDATTCAACGNPGDLLACTRCKTKYCGKECQRMDWKSHKPRCVALQQVRAWSERDWDVFTHYWDAF